jgi:hypothetical protein
MNDRFHIEHPRRGTFRALDNGGFSDGPKARFSLTGSRSDPEKTKIFDNFSDAWNALQSIPTPTRWECSILIWNPVEIRYYKLERTS